jgi:hypothetical protein
MAPKRPFSELEWNLTPEPIRHYILYLEKLVSDMARRIEQQDKILKAHAQRLEQLEVRTGKTRKIRVGPLPPTARSKKLGGRRKTKRANAPKAAKRAIKGTANRCSNRPSA